MKGYREAEILGRHYSSFYPAEDVATHKPERHLRLAAAAGRVQDEGWRIRKDGTRFWADVLITPLRNDEGTLVGFSKVTRDIKRNQWMSIRPSRKSSRSPAANCAKTR